MGRTKASKTPKEKTLIDYLSATKFYVFVFDEVTKKTDWTELPPLNKRASKLPKDLEFQWEVGNNDIEWTTISTFQSWMLSGTGG